MNIVPHGNRLLVEVFELNKTSIVIPDTVDKSEFSVWRVVGVGAEVKTDAFNAGDEVVLWGDGVVPLKPAALYGDRKLALVDVDNVLAKVERAAEDVPARGPRLVKP